MPLRWQLNSLALLVAASACYPAPHVILNVEDPENLAAGLHQIAIGENLERLQNTGLARRTFPVSVVVTHTVPGAERDIWVEARADDGTPLARGWVRANFRRKLTRTQTVLLRAICDVTAAHDTSCALAAEDVGVCRGGDCGRPLSSELSTIVVAPRGAVAADGVQMATIQVTVKDTAGDVVPRQTVELGVSGQGHTLNHEDPVTAVDGTTVATLTSVVAESKIVSALVDPAGVALPLDDRAVVEFSSSVPSVLTSTLTASPTVNVLADGLESSIITVQVRDSLGNAVADQEVELTVVAGEGTVLTPGATHTGPSGGLTASLRSTEVGDKWVSAVLDAHDTAVEILPRVTVNFVSRVPAVTSITLPSPPYGGCIRVEYGLWQARNQPVDLLATIQRPDGSEFILTRAPSETGMYGAPTSNSSGGHTNSFSWASLRDVPDAAGGVLVLHLTPSLGELVGTRVSTVVAPDNLPRWQLASSVQTPTNAIPARAVAGDLDRDGNLDLIGAVGADLHLSLGDGAGGLDNAVSLNEQAILGTAAETLISDAFVGDANHDGLPDVIALVEVYNDADMYLVSHFGNGDGTLAPPAVWAVVTREATPSIGRARFAAGDFNRDGLLDVAMTRAGSTGAAVAFGDGAGGWMVQELPLAFSEISTFVAVADRNGDGPLDVILRLWSTPPFVAFEGDGAGGFIRQDLDTGTAESGERAFVMTDIDGENLLDIAAYQGDGLGVFLNSLAPASYYERTTVDMVPGIPGHLSTYDMTGEGRTDLMLQEFNSHNIPAAVGLYAQDDGLNTDNTLGFDLIAEFGEPSGAQDDGTAHTVGDFNNDGVPDLATIDNRYPGPMTMSVYLSETPRHCDPELMAPSAVTVPGVPVDVAVGDTNVDGNLDVLTVSYGTNTLASAHGRGEGTFEDSISVGVCDGLVACDGPVAVAVGDVNGDRIADVVVGLKNSSSLSILYGGVAGFSPPASVPLSESPADLLLVDLDGDGIDDAVVSSAADAVSPGHVVVLRGDGVGGLAQTGSVTVGFEPGGLAVGDIDGDGDLDVVVANAGSDDVSVLLWNDGLVSTTPVAVGAEPLAVVLAQVDEDEHIDLLAANGAAASVTVALGDGTGLMTPVGLVATPDGQDPTALVALGEWPETGRTVWAMSLSDEGGVVLVHPDETGWQPLNELIYVHHGTPLALATGDLDNDGDIDLASVDGSSGRVTTDIGLWRFRAPLDDGDPPRALRSIAPVVGHGPAADVATLIAASDGRADMVTVHPSTNEIVTIKHGTQVVCPNNPDERGYLVTAYATGSDPSAMVTADVDGDAAADVVVTARATDEVWVHFNRYTGELGSDNFADAPLVLSLPTGCAPSDVISVDLGFNGKRDLVVVCPGTDSVAVFSGEGGRAFAARADVSLAGGSTPSQVAAADLDRDQALDLITANPGNGTVAILYGTPSETEPFAAAEYRTPTLAPSDVAIADLNNDTVPDLIVVDAAARKWVLAKGVRVANGWSMTVELERDCPGTPRDVVIGKLDGDSRPEVLIAQDDPGTLSVWFGDEQTSFVRGRHYASSDGTVAVALGHLSGGNHIEAVTASATSAQVSMFLEKNHSNLEEVCSCDAAGGATWLLAMPFLWSLRRRYRKITR